jgi:histidinol-phosphate phosphatase family protein
MQRLLNRAGFAVVVVTNQSGVARGLFDEAFVRDTHRMIAETLAAGGTRVEGFYYCPHHPEATVPSYRQACACRKPKPGLLRQATAELDLDPRGRSLSEIAGRTSKQGQRSAPLACSFERATAAAKRRPRWPRTRS